MNLCIVRLALIFALAPLLVAQEKGRPEPVGARLCRVDHKAKGGAVVDGDTIHLLDLDASVRIFGVDAEETFTKTTDEETAAEDFEAYARSQRGDNKRPVKFGTPFGVSSKQFAIDFFKGVDEVRFVPDDPRQEREYYGRYLGHLLVDRAGGPVNYAVELVRAGHSPYFVKYGPSRLFHNEFVAAEEEARKKGLGIWSREAGVPAHYPDYAERLQWWHRRRDAIAHFQKTHAQDPAYFQLGYEDVMERLKSVVAEEPGRTVIVFGIVGEKTEALKQGIKGTLSHRHKRDLAVHFVEQKQVDRLRWTEFQDECVYLEATVWPAKGGLGLELWVDEDSRVWQEPESGSGK